MEAAAWDGAGITSSTARNNPFGNTTEALTSKTFNGKRIAIRQLASPGDAAGCQIVFISDAEKANLSQLLPQLQRLPVLTVGESEGFAETGGMINLSSDKNKVRLEINPDAAQKAGLTISSQLLKLATLVKS